MRGEGDGGCREGGGQFVTVQIGFSPELCIFVGITTSWCPRPRPDCNLSKDLLLLKLDVRGLYFLLEFRYNKQLLMFSSKDYLFIFYFDLLKLNLNLCTARKERKCFHTASDIFHNAIQIGF